METNPISSLSATTPSTPVLTPITILPTDLKAQAEADLQAKMDALAGNVRKESTAKARKDLMKELGIDADDPDAVKTVRGKLTAALATEEANKTELQKLTDLLAIEVKKTADLQALVEQGRKDKFISDRDVAVAKALGSAKVNTSEAGDLQILLLAKYPTLFEGVVDDTGRTVEKGMKVLVDHAKKEYPKYFANPAPGVPSNFDGRVSEPNAAAKQNALVNQYLNMKRGF